jgi:hypothetical protein
MYICMRIHIAWRRQFNVELNFWSHRGSYISGVAVFEHVKKIGTIGINAHGHAADFDDQTEALDFGDQFRQETRDLL